MTLDRRRYGRQIRLAEIGEAGQARLCETTAAVRTPAGSLARAVEERYLRGAGLAVDGDPPVLAPVAIETLGLQHPAARDVGEGALAALLAIRAALGLSGEP